MSLGNIDLSPQLVQAVRDAVDVVSLASDHTRLQKAGHRYKGLCPLHKEKSPSFSVDPEKGLFYCFGCGAGGDAIRLHMLTTGDDFPAAIETLAQRYGIPITRHSTRARKKDERDVSGALSAAFDYFREQLEGSPEARKYLEDRRIPPELIELYGLGYAPDGWQTMVDALTPRVPFADLEAAGLAGRSDKADGRPYSRFRHRLMFPIRSATGRLLGFGGRTLGDDKAKYVNTQETEQFHKGRLLYGLYEAKKRLRDTGVAVLAEGYFDVLAVVAAGEPGAVASMGTALTPEQAALLSRFSNEVVIAYDGDEAGEKAARRCLPALLGKSFKIRRARLGAGQDPDSLRLEEGEEALVRVLGEASDAVLEELQRLAPVEARQNPQAQANAASEVAELLRTIPDPIVRRGYSRPIADRLDVPEDLLWRRAGSKGSATGGRPAPSVSEEAAPAASQATDLQEAWRLEKEVLENLLRTRADIPAADRLPDPEIFPDRTCREIYRAFLNGYRSTGQPPDLKTVERSLDVTGEAGDLLGRFGATFEPGAEPMAKSTVNGTLYLLTLLDAWWSKRGIRWAKEQLNGASDEKIHALAEWKKRIRRDGRAAQEGYLWCFPEVQNPSVAVSAGP